VSLAKKLQLREGQSLAVLDRPAGLELGLPEDATEGGLLAFCTTAAELEDHRGPIVEAARADDLVWVAYPKAGQLGTDLNRDSLARLLAEDGIRPVRQVALDDTWSALRFRPGSRQ
jgi:hypothetical protein